LNYTRTNRDFTMAAFGSGDRRNTTLS